MSAASTSERLSSIVEEKPIYVNHHSQAALALVRLTDYSNWSLAESEWLVTLLHSVHLRVDALVQQYGFYKVDFHSGDFTVVANVSGEVDSRAPRHLLEFAGELMSALTEMETPHGKVRVQISLVTGPLRSAILGKTALKYSVHGRSEVIARQLLQLHGQDGCIVASKEFVENVDEGMITWKLLPSQGNDCEDAMLHMTESNADIPSKMDSHPGNNAWWRLWQLIPSLCFSDAEMERHFRLFQADRLAFLDVLYISLSASMAVISAYRTLRFGINATSAIYFILSLLGVSIPLSGMMLWNEHYRRHRLCYLAFYRLIKLILVVFFSFQQQTTSLMSLITNYAILHGLHAIGTPLVLPVHIIFQMLSVLAIGFKSTALCNWDASTGDGCSHMTVSLVLFTLTLLVPCLIIYRSEKDLRQVYSFGSSSPLQKP